MDTNGDGSVASGEKSVILVAGGVASDKGIGLAMHQTFDNTGNPIGSHTGSINGSESPQFDIWGFFGNTGLDYLSSPMNDLGLDANGNHKIDMSGWVVGWNGIDAIPMGGDTANFAIDTGVGTMVCSKASCSNSSTFALSYNAHVPLKDVSGFGGVAYSLKLTGVVGTNLSHIPVPAAVWLFGSGLVGLVGVARRKKAAV
ncbi:MAG TPA: VPLPA-CTERM sorting domain-containing protein [Gammaproteobacteria bacterium]|nr:VPLPA-CTERM sorting domain-containing protein [Gammaproteobacteria bacterium]